MTLQRKRKRSRLIIATGAIMALVVGATIFIALQAGGYKADRPAVAMTDVVVAAREIASRKTIEDGDLVMRSVPADESNATAFRDITEVLGRISAITIPAGQMVSPNMLASTEANQPFALPNPGSEFDPEGPDVRAYSVSVPDERAVAGTIQPGQRVDILATIPIQPPAEEAATGEDGQPVAESAAFITGPSTKVTLQNIVVLARSGPVYILNVDLAMSEKLAEITAAGGTFTFVLRPDPDVRTAETEGSTLDSLVSEFGFPIPQPPDVDGGNTPASAAP